jgi:methionyl-tRNA formyltransferase
MRVTFFGSGAFAVPSLETLARDGHDVLAVVSQPDRPKGRGMRLAHSPVKTAALALGLPLRQPARVRDAAVIAELAALSPEVQVVVAFGQILPREVIEISPLGTVNVHASLLPRYRGAAPIQWAIARGETETGITTMLIDQGLDTGPILMSASTAIGSDETAGELEARLAPMGAKLLTDTLAALARRALAPRPQDNARASHAPLLHKQDGRIDWHAGAAEISRRVRAFNPWPCAQTLLDGRVLRVLRAHPAGPSTATPGEIRREAHNRLMVACGDGNELELLEVQPENRKAMSVSAFLAGAHLMPGHRFA